MGKLGNAPAAVQASLGRAAVKRTSLTLLERQVVLLTSSFANQCPCCGLQLVMRRKDDLMGLNDGAEEVDLVARLRHRIAELEQRIEVEQKRHHKHLQLAAEVHRSLLPSPARTDRAEIDVRYEPLDGVGGDYCQMHFPGDDVCYITMCDVTGHGVGAALLAARVSSEVRDAVYAGLSPAGVVDRLNRFVCEKFGRAGLLLTFFAARIDLQRLEITWSGAGHPSPILVRADRRTVVRLESQNLIIGVRPESLAAEPEHRTRLGPGDRVLFYTDGVSEVFDATGAELGEEGLAGLMVDAMPAGVSEMIDRILEQVAGFQDGPVVDDRTLILFGASCEPRAADGAQAGAQTRPRRLPGATAVSGN